jgi:hypothetical protein
MSKHSLSHAVVQLYEAMCHEAGDKPLKFSEDEIQQALEPLPMQGFTGSQLRPKLTNWMKGHAAPSSGETVSNFWPERFARINGRDIETPEEREAKLAGDRWSQRQGGGSDAEILDYLAKQPTGFTTTIAGKTYLRGMDGIFRRDLMSRNQIHVMPQDYLNHAQVHHYLELLKNPETRTTVDPVTVHPESKKWMNDQTIHPPVGQYILTDGHHRLEAADQLGFDQVPTWTLLESEHMNKTDTQETEHSDATDHDSEKSKEVHENEQ